MKHPWTCSACGMKFNGLTLFETHRYGKPKDIHPHYGRSCRTPDELVAKGWRERKGIWSGPPMGEAFGFWEKSRQ